MQKKLSPKKTSYKEVMKVRVQAGAKHESVQRLGTTFIIAVKEPAAENRANLRVREVLSAELMVPFAQVRLVSGHHKPNKMFEIIRS